MSVIEVKKNRKLFQVSKELNLAHTTLMEFLNSKGFDTPKKHLSIVSQEMYEEIVKKFDQMRWQKYLEDQKPGKEAVEQRKSEDLRIQELDRILTEVDTAAAKITEKPRAADIDEVSEIPETGTEVIEKETGKTAPEKIISETAKAAAEDETQVSEKADVVDKAKRTEITGDDTRSVAITEAQTGEPVAATKTEHEEKAALESADISVDDVSEEAVKPYKTQTVDNVVKEALKLARRKPVKKIEVDKEEETKKPETEAAKEKKKRRRRKKPRRPETPSAAAIDLEKEKRAKIKKKDKGKDEVKPVAKRKRRKGKKKKVDAEEVKLSIKQTLAQIEEKGKGKRKKKRAVDDEIIEEDTNVLKVTEFISAQELANLMDINVTQIIGKAMEMGLLISINQRLDKDTIELITDEFEFTVEFLSGFEEETEEIEEEIDAEKLPRAPVVTVMGHVDHGKTSLLDHIRESNIIDGESGGITQHIGAYRVESNGRFITFLDTPGHEAFTAMRARGAQVTDIVVLVVAADDQVMPQTIEAIDHAQAAGVPMVIAINKIDKPNSQPDRVRQQLADRGILVEEWGGKYQCAEISAKFGKNIDKLMDEILLLADLSELKAPVDCKAKGVIIDAKLDKGRGSIATVLIERGTLDVGDNFVCGQHSGKVRAMLDERGMKVEMAAPSEPVQVLGFNGTPQAGDSFLEVATEKEAKNISLKRQLLLREQSFRQIRMITLDQISKQIKEGEVSHLPLIIKGDVQGSVEALSDSLMKIQNEEVTVEVIRKGVGAVTESDVLLAAASGAIIIGFHVHANKNARELATREKVEIKSYRIIYDVIEDVKKALEGMLKPRITEEIIGEVEVRDLFKISSYGTIAGCHVSDGKIERSNKIKVYRDGVEVFDGTIETLKRFKDDVKEVVSGFECGIKVKDFNDIKISDIIQAYRIVETKRTLND